MNQMLQSIMDDNPDFDNNMGEPEGLKRGLSLSIMDKADEFAMDTSKRERAILINIAIDQG